MHEKRTLIHQKICCGENYYTLVIKRVFTEHGRHQKQRKVFYFLFYSFCFCLNSQGSTET